MGTTCGSNGYQHYHVNSRLKHYILKDYLSAWLPILSSNHDVLSYVDCFAGAGSADFGNTSAEGSPLVALRVINEFLQNPYPNVRKPSIINVSLVERDAITFLRLSEEIKKVTLDPRIRVSAECGDANEFLARRLSLGASSGCPEFLFVDPNYELPDITVVRQYVKRPKTEIFLNFMYAEIVRNISTQEGWKRLFGNCPFQLLALLGVDGAYDVDKIVALYAAQTQSRYYVPFRVCYGPDEYTSLKGRVKYVLVHLSNNFLAFDKMLTAMCNNSESDNSLQISMNQPTLFPTLDHEHLIASVKGKYQGTGMKMSFDTLREVNWHLYASAKMWRSCLRVLKDEGLAVVHRVSSKTKRGISDDDMVEFPRR